jgi:hypothetical protein
MRFVLSMSDHLVYLMSVNRCVDMKRKHVIRDASAVIIVFEIARFAREGIVSEVNSSRSTSFMAR